MHASPLRLLLASMLAVFACAFAAPGAALAEGGLGFRVDSDSGSAMEGGFLNLSGPAGSTVSGSFVITNTQRAPVNLSVYPSDGLTATTTGVVYSDSNDGLQGAGAWFTLDRRSASLTGNSEQPVHFTAAIPAGASPGDHVGGVVLEQSSKAAAKVNGAITQVVRNVVPVMIVVTGPAAPQIVLRDAQLTTLPGSAALAVTVKMTNTGLKLCKPLLTVAMGDSSDTGQQVIRQLDTVLPGDSAPYPLPWPANITPGSHLVHVTVTNCGKSQTIVATVHTPKSLTDGEPNATTPVGNNVNTTAEPGTTTFTPADSGKTTGSHGKGSGHRKHHKSAAAASGASASGGAIPPATKPPAANPGAGGKKHQGWFSRATHAVSNAVTHHAPEVLARATVPASILGLIGLIFFAQEAIDRRDPKLALAPLHREQDLAFDSDPLRTRTVVPSPTALAVDR